MNSSEGRPLVAVSVVTRGRPKMLAQLLNSLASMGRPDDADIRFIIVENNDRRTLDAVIDGFSRSVDEPVIYGLQPALGIAAARNKAIDLALEAGAGLIAFVDDDEQVDHRWLTALLAGLGNAALAGGPVQIAAPSENLTRLQQAVHQGLVTRFKAKADAMEFIAGNRPGKVKIVTSNWLCDASVFTREHIRFDEAIGLGSGSDMRFCLAVKARGLPIAWVPEAIVYETVPPERLSLGYQFSRAREQSKSAFANKRQHATALTVCGLGAAGIALRGIGLIVLLPLIPVTGGYGLLVAARSAGWIVGRLAGMLGARSRLYETVKGS